MLRNINDASKEAARQLVAREDKNFDRVILACRDDRDIYFSHYFSKNDVPQEPDDRWFIPYAEIENEQGWNRDWESELFRELIKKNKYFKIVTDPKWIMQRALENYDYATNTVTSHFRIGGTPILLAWLIENHYYFSKINEVGNDGREREVVMAIPSLKTRSRNPIINTDYYKPKYDTTVIDIIQKNFAMNVLGVHWVKKPTALIAQNRPVYVNRKIAKPEKKRSNPPASESTFSLFSNTSFVPTLRLQKTQETTTSASMKSDAEPALTISKREEKDAPFIEASNTIKKRPFNKENKIILLTDNSFDILPEEKISLKAKPRKSSVFSQTTAEKISEYVKIIVAENMKHEKKIANKKEVIKEIIKAIHQHELGGSSFLKLQKKISRHLNLEYKKTGCLCFFRKKTVSLVFDKASFSRDLTHKKKSLRA